MCDLYYSKSKMKLKICILLFFITACNFSYPQTDSIESNLHTAEGKEKIELFIKISDQYRLSNTLKSIEYARNAFNLSQKAGNNDQKARALNLIASGYYSLGQSKLALEYFMKSLELSEITNNKAGIASATENIGKIYKKLADYDVAIEYYQKSLAIEKKSKNKTGIANIAMELGSIYYTTGTFDKALIYFSESLQMNIELNDNNGIWEAYNMIGNTHFGLKNSDSSLSYFILAHNLSVKINDLDKQATSLQNLGMFYFDKKNYQKSLEYYNSALNIEIGQDDFWAEANTIKTIGEIYMFLKKYDESLNYFNRAVEIAGNIGAKRLLTDIYSDLSSFYKIHNNYQKAYDYFKMATEVKDQVTNEASINQISEIESKYTMRSKDQQLQIITQENKVQALQIKTQKYIIYIIASLSLFILALFFIFYSRLQINKRAKKNLEEKNIKITEQKILLEKALAELKENAEIHESLIKNIQDGIFVIQNEKIRFANESFAKIAGYPIETIYDMDYREFIHPDDLARIETNYKKRLAGEYVPTSYEFRIKNKEGKTVYLSLSVGLINYLGKPAHIGTVKDIHQIKYHENELIRQKEKAELATKSKSFFLANMSHEIRNHMNSIIGITEVLSETKLDPEQEEFVNVIKNSGNNLLNIINEILDFSKIEAGQIVLEPVEFNLRDMVRNIFVMHEMNARQSGLYLNSEFGEDIPEKLIGDPTRLGQILINLINNAIKFTEKGGVTIKVEHKEEKYFGSFKNAVPCTIKFEIIDTGLGITSESIDKLFKPFSQTHSAIQRKHKGTGLGLAICKQLVELMEGEIGVNSEVEKGSTFWFTVRLLNPDVNNIAAENARILDNLNSRSSRILVVEDHLLNKQLMINILTRAGYTAHAAENGKVGYDLYKLNHYDAILMDIQMPIMDGIQATRLIREYEVKNNLKKSVIIAVTAHTKEGEQQKLFDAGMDFYLSKPFKSSELTGLLNDLKLT